MVFMSEKKDDTDYCEWCGEFPYYISIYKNGDYEKEILLCKECYQNIEE